MMLIAVAIFAHAACSAADSPRGGASSGDGSGGGSSGASASGADAGASGASADAGLGATNDGGNPGSGGDAADGGRAPAVVTLRTLDTRQYVSATGGGGGTVTATSAAAAANESFRISDLTSSVLTDGDSIRIAASNGSFLSAAGGGDLTAQATVAGADETFVLHRIAGPGVVSTGDLVALETKSTTHYVSAINGGGGALQTSAPWAKGWESFWIAIAGQPSPVPASKQKVLSYLASIQGKRTVAGQHNKNNASPSDATDQVTSITGKAPGLWSGDFLFGGDVADRATMIAQAKKEWTKGSLVQLMYHACSPTGDESCSWDAIGGGSPAKLSDAQWSDLVTDGGTLNAAWKARLDALSVFFAQLDAAGVAPLFRPEHEMNQSVFWWGGRGGDGGTRRLYQITHDYLVGVKGFRNIVWVWDLQDFGSLASDVVSYNPGADYYDIAALDVYDGGYDTAKYTTMKNAVGSKPIAIGECSTVPTATELTQQPGWVFFMLWPDFIAQNQSALPSLYAAPNVVTLAQMPGW
jgi:hypothetical protein